MEVECVVTHSPGHCALLTGGTGLVGLTLDAEVHDVVPADGAVVHHNVPSPKSNGVPFLYFKPLPAREERVIIIIFQIRPNV